MAPARASRAETLLMHGSTDIEAFTPILMGFADASPGLRIIYEQRSTNEIYLLAERACLDGEAGADLLVSSSVDQQVKLVNDGCAQPHVSPETQSLPSWANWRDEVFGVTSEPAVMVYNRALVPAGDVPRSRFDLIDLLRPPGNLFVGRIATYDIERSGLGLSLCLSGCAAGNDVRPADRSLRPQRCRRYLLLRRDHRLGCRGGISDRLQYAGLLCARNVPPRMIASGVVALSDYTLVLSRAALVPRNASNASAAKRFIDFALSKVGRGLLADAALIVSFDASSEEDATALQTAGSASGRSRFPRRCLSASTDKSEGCSSNSGRPASTPVERYPSEPTNDRIWRLLGSINACPEPEPATPIAFPPTNRSVRSRFPGLLCNPAQNDIVCGLTLFWDQGVRDRCRKSNSVKAKRSFPKAIERVLLQDPLRSSRDFLEYPRLGGERPDRNDRHLRRGRNHRRNERDRQRPEIGVRGGRRADALQALYGGRDHQPTRGRSAGGDGICAHDESGGSRLDQKDVLVDQPARVSGAMPGRRRHLEDSLFG